MVYKRSSFLKFVKDKYDCVIKPIGRGGIRIEYGNEHFHMLANKEDEIDYEEIYMCYNRLLLPDLPGHKDLQHLE